MDIVLPELSLVVLVGACGSGKSTFAAKHFLRSEVISSDYCRGLVCDDENSQEATKNAFDLVNYIADKRLGYGRLTVIDATSVKFDDRKHYLKLARDYHFMPVAVVLNLPEAVCHERNSTRLDRNFGSHVVRNQSREIKRSIKRLKREGFRYIYVLESEEQIANVEIQRQPMWTNKKSEHGPFDIIGDIHGCFDELLELLAALGYQVNSGISSVTNEKQYRVSGPRDRRVIFVGDIVDRGPRSNDCLRLVMDMVELGIALCVPGNHESKLYKKLSGKNVKLTHGLAETVEQLKPESDAFKERVSKFINSLVSHYVLDNGKLVVAHAGMKEAYQGRGSGKVRGFAMYGETTGETDEFGLPIRYNWAVEYKGKALVVYGHTPVPRAEFINNTICIDTGCVFGGRLTALRYPEKELVDVLAAKTYYESASPLVSEGLSRADGDLLDINDLLGRHHISTQFDSTVIINEGNTLAALEALSRYAVNPRWLVYLPPTMSPPETSLFENHLEYPAEAFSYYRRQGVSEVVCEEKHMGSRCVIHICRNAEAVKNTFGLEGDEIGICYTRTGRRFFTDKKLERRLLESLRDVLTGSGFWDAFETSWVSLDCELMPWSLKAQELIRTQYAAVGSSASNALSATNKALELAESRGVDVSKLLSSIRERSKCAEQFKQAYRPYCWNVEQLSDLRLSPFQILATEGTVHTSKNHVWQMEQIPKHIGHDKEWLYPTQHKVVNIEDDASMNDATEWWKLLTTSGGEGMVVKPANPATKGKKGIIQPAIKIRGSNYLRIIYGMDYDRPDNLEQLRNRNLSLKRRMAAREYMLGIEALTRFVNKQAFQHVHECILGVLALESEPVDPRL